MLKNLRLTGITEKGYLVEEPGRGLRHRILVPHEAVVAILTGLSDPLNKFVQQVALQDQRTWFNNVLADAARHACRQLAGVAWVLGVCSWNKAWRAVEYSAAIFHYESE